MPVRTYTTAAGDSFTEVTGSVFEAMTDDPKEVASLDVRSFLLRALRTRIKEARWTQEEAARRLGVQQPRISDMMRGRLSAFSLDALVNYTVRAGLSFHASVSPPDAKRASTPVVLDSPEYAANDAGRTVPQRSSGTTRALRSTVSHASSSAALVHADDEVSAYNDTYALAA